MSIKLKFKGVVRWDLESPISLGYLAHCSLPLFHEYLHSVFGVLLYSISESCDTYFAGQVACKPWVLLVSWGAHTNSRYFDTCSRVHASAASAYNWDGYWTFNVMVLKCTHYITLIILNLSQTACTIASQLTSLGSRLCTH